MPVHTSLQEYERNTRENDRYIREVEEAALRRAMQRLEYDVHRRQSRDLAIILIATAVMSTALALLMVWHYAG